MSAAIVFFTKMSSFEFLMKLGYVEFTDLVELLFVASGRIEMKLLDAFVIGISCYA